MAFDLRLIPKDNSCGCGVANPIGLWFILISVAGFIWFSSHWFFITLFVGMFVAGFILWSVV